MSLRPALSLVCLPPFVDAFHAISMCKCAEVEVVGHGHRQPPAHREGHVSPPKKKCQHPRHIDRKELGRRRIVYRTGGNGISHPSYEEVEYRHHS